MIKVSSLEKYGIKLDAKDELSQAFGHQVVTKFARRDMSQIDDRSLGGICVTVGNDVGHYNTEIERIGHCNTEIEQIHACDVLPRVWTYWRPSMDWLVQQELTGYKDETDYFGEAVPMEIPTETPEEKEALDAIEKKSPYDVGAHVSGLNKPRLASAIEKIYKNTGWSDPGWPRSNKFYCKCSTISEVQTPAEPVFTQAMFDAGELPPVGAECTLRYMHDSKTVTHSGVVAYASRKYCILNQVGAEILCKIGDYAYEPIKTECEKAINEMVATAINSEDDIAKPIIYEACVKLAKAGYRK